MNSDQRKHRRHSIRLPKYDYSQPGSYYVTVCTKERALLFGSIVNDRMEVDELGRIVGDELMQSVRIRREIALDEWIVMPNHVHAIVVIDPGRGDRPVAPTTRTRRTVAGPAPRLLASFMAGFKSAATARINTLRRTPGAPVWQRNYYEHVVRDDAERERIRRYIIENPQDWAYDEENPHRHAPAIAVGATGRSPISQARTSP